MRIVQHLIEHVQIVAVENSYVLLGGGLGLNVISHFDLVGLGVQELNNISRKSASSVRIHVELYALGNVEVDERVCQGVIHIEGRGSVCVVHESFKVYIGELYVSVKLQLIAGEHSEVLVKGARIVDLGVATGTLRLGASAALFRRGNSAVIKTDRHEVLESAVEQRLSK